MWRWGCVWELGSFDSYHCFCLKVSWCEEKLLIILSNFTKQDLFCGIPKTAILSRKWAREDCSVCERRCSDRACCVCRGPHKRVQERVLTWRAHVSSYVVRTTSKIYSLVVNWGRKENVAGQPGQHFAEGVQAMPSDNTDFAQVEGGRGDNAGLPPFPTRSPLWWRPQLQKFGSCASGGFTISSWWLRL